MFQALTALIEFIVYTVWGLFVGVFNWIELFVTQYIPDALWSLVPQGLADYISSFNLDGLAGVVAPVTWFFPIWAIAGIYATAYSLAASIRLVRFIIGWIPTVEG